MQVIDHDHSLTSILNQYNSVRKRSEEICNPLHTEDYIPQPVPFVSPPKWHLAHTTWFFETFLLIPFLKQYQVYDTNYNFLFNSYYNHVGPRVMRAQRGNITRPGIKEVYEYRQHVDYYINILLQTEENDSFQKLIELGLHHEQQHQELMLTDIKYIFGHNPIFPVYDKLSTIENAQAKEKHWVSIAEGVYTIGHQNSSFCFDNEFGSHKTYIQAFEISSELVTNGDYLEFIEANGYLDFNLWLDEGWNWVNVNNIHSPLYWHKIDNNWYRYTLNGLKKIIPNEILSHISYFEASAYAQWKQMRLPTEFEWEVASDKFRWGSRWEWTNSAYLPYPGFSKAPGAVGEYNGKFMINQMVLRGASVATSENHSRYTYRNFFHTEDRWQFTGIRLVK